MNRKLELKSFELRHLKLNSKGQPIIDWFDLTKPNDLLSVESDSQPHEDLFEKLNELREVFATSLGLLKGWDLARENTNKNDDKLREAIRGWNEELLRCKLSGLTITEKGIKVTGSLLCEEGTVGLSSPLIKFENEENDLGETTRRIVEELTIEVWKFIYQEKRADNLFSSQESDKSGLGTTTGKMEKVA